MREIPVKSIILFTFFLLMIAILILVSSPVEAVSINVNTVERTIYLNGGNYTFDDIWNNAAVNKNNSILCNYTTGVWRLNFTIVVQQNATLLINPYDGTTGCEWLKMNSSNSSGFGDSHIDVLGGRLFCNDTNISSWLVDHEDINWSHFRPYIYICPTYLNDSHAEFNNCTIHSLGYFANNDDYWGVTYEEINLGIGTKDPTGRVNSTIIQNNYVGLHLEGVSNFWINDVDIHMYNTTGLYLCVSEYTGLGCDNITVNLSYGSHNDFHDGQALISDGIRTYYAKDCEFQNVWCYDNFDNGFYAFNSDNLTIGNSDFFANGDGFIDGDGIRFNNTDNCTITSGTDSYNNWFSGYCLNGSSNDNLFSYIAGHDNWRADFFIGQGSYSNDFVECHGQDTYNAFEILGDNNNFLGCTAFNESYDGFMLASTASYNYIAYANISNCTFGGAGADLLEYANNNTFEFCEFYNNTWGIWIAPNLVNGVKNNLFNEIFCNESSYGIYIAHCYGNNTLNYTRVFDSWFTGVEVTGSSSNITFNDLVTFHTLNGGYDLQISNESNVTITTDFLMGHNNTNNTIFYPSTYNILTHWAGDGDWDMMTCAIIVNFTDPNWGVANVTHYWGNIPTYARWEVNSTAGVMTQYIGGLSPGYNYQLIVDGVITDNVIAESYYVPNYGTTGVLWFNYSGLWSNHVFELVRGVSTIPASPTAPSGSGGGVSLIKIWVNVKGDDAVVSIKNSAGNVIAYHEIKDGDSYNFSLQSGVYTIEAKGTKKTLINSISPDTMSLVTPNFIEFDFTEKAPGFEIVFVFLALFTIILLNQKRYRKRS